VSAVASILRFPRAAGNSLILYAIGLTTAVSLAVAIGLEPVPPLVIPVLVTLLPLPAAYRRWTSPVAALLMAAFMVLAMFSIGIFYAPSLILLIAGAIAAWRAPAPAARPRIDVWGVARTLLVPRTVADHLIMGAVVFTVAISLVVAIRIEAVASLFIPVLISLVPLPTAHRRLTTLLAVVLMAAFVVLAIASVGILYAPALLLLFGAAAASWLPRREP